MAIDVGVTFPGNPDVRQTRVQALGPMSGLLTGIKVGAIAGAVRAAGVRLPGMLAAPIVGAVAMATRRPAPGSNPGVWADIVTALILRLSGVCFLAGGAGLVSLIVSQGGGLGDGCSARPLPGTGSGKSPPALATIAFLVAAAVGLFIGASRRMPVRKVIVTAALCASVR